MIKRLFHRAEQYTESLSSRLLLFSRKPAFLTILSIVFMVMGIIFGWTYTSINPSFLDRFLRICCLVSILIFSLTKKRVFFSLALVSVLFYPLFTFLSPSYFTVMANELDRFLTLKKILSTQVYESNMSNLDVVQGNYTYFVAFGFYVSLVGVIARIRDFKTARFVIVSTLVPAVFLGLVWLSIFSSIFFMERNFSAGRGLYSVIKGVNTLSHVISQYDYIYFKAGEFDIKHNKETWEKDFYRASIYKENGEFTQSLALMKSLRGKAEKLIDLQLTDLSAKVITSHLPLSDQLSLLKSINEIHQTTDQKIYLACLYLKSRSYHNALFFIEDALPSVKNKYILADIRDILGDVYGDVHEVKASRTNYKKSLDTYDRVKNGNFHAYKGLAGW